MKIGVSTACFYPNTIEQSVRTIASLDLHLIEVFFNTESELNPQYIRELKTLLEQHSISVISAHPFTSLMEGVLLFSQYERRTRDGIEQYRRYFSSACALGAKYIVLHGERLIPQMHETQEILENKLRNYHRLCEVAAQEGITVAQENVAWCRSSSPEFLQLLYDNIPQLQYVLDIKQAYRANKNWKDYLDIIAPRLANVHINDFSHEHGCLLPGQGIMNYLNLFNALKAAQYDEQVLIEVYSSNYSNTSEIIDAVQFLQCISKK